MVYPGLNCIFSVILGLDTNAVCVELAWSLVVVVFRNLGFTGTVTRWSREIFSVERLYVRFWRHLLIVILKLLIGVITSTYSNQPVFSLFLGQMMCSLDYFHLTADIVYQQCLIAYFSTNSNIKYKISH